MTTQTASEADHLDEAAIAAAVAAATARLKALDGLSTRTTEVRGQSQDRFDTLGLPRGLAPLDAL